MTFAMRLAAQRQYVRPLKCWYPFFLSVILFLHFGDGTGGGRRKDV